MLGDKSSFIHLFSPSLVSFGGTGGEQHIMVKAFVEHENIEWELPSGRTSAQYRN